MCYVTGFIFIFIFLKRLRLYSQKIELVPIYVIHVFLQKTLDC